ncbi:hypothetical protein N7456_004568 [Penicillium angulare]|uniref:Uncharacterized protein n=1 Tax=Penicillium angulare TaxID=116970 RepID=A0A9W9KJP8_9EURO|nr:hypothetical protein N7456_004568 [Penicillium angulare]
MVLSPFRACEGSPTYQEEYRNSSFVPKVINAWYGLQVVAPDTPYVAAAGTNTLYFIDTRFDKDTAQHIKTQVEKASIPVADEYTAIDEFTFTAEQKNKAGETTFVFDPPYAKVFFARGINKRNPEAKLPEHEYTPGSVITYDLDEITGKIHTTSNIIWKY